MLNEAKKNLKANLPPIVGNLIKVDDYTEKSVFANKNKSKISINEQSCEELFPYKPVNGIIPLGDGKASLVVKTTAINKEKGKELFYSLINSYGDILNRLTDEIKIVASNFIHDVRPSIERLEELYLKADEHDKCFIENEIEKYNYLTSRSDVLETEYYIVFTTSVRKDTPEKMNKLLSKRLFDIYDVIGRGLKNIGIKCKELSNDQLAEMMYYYFNPFKKGVQKFIPGSPLVIDSPKINLSTPENSTNDAFNLSEEYEKDSLNTFDMGQTDLWNKVVPYSVDYQQDNYLVLGDTYVSFVEIHEYPNQTVYDWLARLHAFRENIDITYNIKPLKIADVQRSVETQLINQKVGLTKKKRNKLGVAEYVRVDSSSSLVKEKERLVSDIEDVEERIAGESKLFNLSILIRTKAKSLEELSDLNDRVHGIVGDLRCMSRIPSNDMLDAIHSSMPVGGYKLSGYRNLYTDGLAHAFPFTSQTLYDPLGILLGKNVTNNTLLSIDFFNALNPILGIVGKSGAGKSVTSMTIYKALLVFYDIPGSAIDPDGEMTRLCEAVNGEYIDIFIGSDIKLNILEPIPDRSLMDQVDENGNVTNDKFDLLKPNIDFMVRIIAKGCKLDDDERKKLDRILGKLFEKFGFGKSYNSFFTFEDDQFGMSKIKVKRKPPTISQLIQFANNEAVDKAFKGTSDLVEKLKSFSVEGTFSIFDGYTNIDLDSKRIFYGLKNLPSEYKELVTFLLFDIIWKRGVNNPDRKVLYIEEAHYLVRNDELAEYVYDIAKRFRKFKGLLMITTQNVTDFMKSKFGPEIIKACAHLFMMKQSLDDAKRLGEAFNIPYDLVLKMPQFNHKEGECYLYTGDEIIHANIYVTQFEIDTYEISFVDDGVDLEQAFKLKEKLTFDINEMIKDLSKLEEAQLTELSLMIIDLKRLTRYIASQVELVKPVENIDLNTL